MGKSGCILAIDQGTTSTTPIVIGAESRPGPCASEFRQHYPAGWVEHDPEEIWGTTVGGAAGTGAARLGAAPRRHRHHQPARDLRALGSPHGQAHLPRHRLAGSPHRGPVRTLKSAGPTEPWPTRRGWCSIPISRPPRSLAAGSCRGRTDAREGGALAFGTIDTWLLWRLTGGERSRDRQHQRLAHAALDIRKDAWDDECWRFSTPAIDATARARLDAVLGETEPQFWATPADPRRGGRSAGGHVRPGLLPAGNGPRTPTARAACCC